MKRRREEGLTLIELLISITIMGIIVGGAAALLSICLQAHAYGTSKSALHREGLMAMERMTSGVRNCTYLLIPNAHSVSRDMLAFSGSVNDDDDYYFDDPLFPRVDEDLKDDADDNGKAGLKDIDDNGDGFIDNGLSNQDDDEDGQEQEDPVDGLDNDGDGNIDEDVDKNVYGGVVSGLPGFDDDGNGSVDDEDKEDDDEDGSKNEDPLNPLVYVFDGTDTLTEEFPEDNLAVALSTHVTAFTVTYEPPDATHDPRILISLTLTSDDGENTTFSEYAYPRNIVQKTGKKVR